MDALTFVTTEDIFAELGRRYETVLLAVQTPRTTQTKTHWIWWQDPMAAKGLAGMADTQITAMLMAISLRARQRGEECNDEYQDEDEDDDIPI